MGKWVELRTEGGHLSCGEHGRMREKLKSDQIGRGGASVLKIQKKHVGKRGDKHSKGKTIGPGELKKNRGCFLTRIDPPKKKNVRRAQQGK